LTTTVPTPPRYLPILLCLALVLAYPFFSVPVQAIGVRLAPSLGVVESRIVTEGAIWLYMLVVLAIALLWEGRSLGSIGLRRPGWSTLGFALGGALALAFIPGLVGVVIYRLLHLPQHADAQAAALTGGSVIYALFLAIRAGVVEEILFRGIAIEQLTALTGNRWLAAIVTMVVFTLVHALHFDWIQLIPIFCAAAVLTGLYLWRRDLVANIIAHILVDAAGLMTLAAHMHGAHH
jgi:membrane protease YdiL (CAAX protease family)